MARKFPRPTGEVRSDREEGGEGDQADVETERSTTPKLARKVATGEGGMMGFGPYHMNTYGDVLRYSPHYTKYLIAEGGGNQKTRLAHWAMAFAVSTFLEEDRQEAGRPFGGSSQP